MFDICSAVATYVIPLESVVLRRRHGHSAHAGELSPPAPFPQLCSNPRPWMNLGGLHPRRIYRPVHLFQRAAPAARFCWGFIHLRYDSTRTGDWGVSGSVFFCNRCMHIAGSWCRRIVERSLGLSGVGFCTVSGHGVGLFQ